MSDHTPKEDYDRPPEALFFKAAPQGFMPIDQQGFIRSAGEWAWIKKGVDAFFAAAPRQSVEDHNLLLQDEIEEWHGLHEQGAPPQQARPGYIYLAKSETGHYKIGLSVNPEKRIQHFDTQMPVDVTLIHTFPADNMYSAESQLHSIFTHERVNGEWFNLSQEDVEWLCCITGYNDETFHANS